MTVMPLLNRLFNVRDDEWPRLLFLYLMFFVSLLGINWGEAIVEAAFLRQVGLQFLPLIIIGNAVCSIIAVVIYTAYADRVSNDKLLIAILTISIAGIVAGLIFLGWGMVAVTYPLLYLVLNVPLRDIFNVHWATYINGFYDTRAAKRVIPVLFSGARIAAIVSGATMSLLNSWFSPGGIITIWLVTMVIMVFLVWLMPRLLGQPAIAGKEQPTTAQAQRSLDHIREGYLYVSQSPFLRWLAASSLVMMVLLAIINYQTGKVMLAELNSVAAISNFTGALNAISNLVALPFQLFLLSRMIGWMGLGNASLIFPAITAVSCTGLIAVPGIPTAALGYLNRFTFRTTLRNPVDSLLYNAVPMRIKGRARAFIGGLVIPLGSLIGGLMLILASYLETAGGSISWLLWFMPAMIGLISIIYMIATWATRQRYSQALIAMLEQEDYSSLLLQETSDLTVDDPAMLSRLREKFERPDASPEFTIFIAQLISQVGGSQAATILSQAARAAGDARIRSAIIDILVAADARGDAVRQLYADLLADPDSQVRQAAIGGLEHLDGPADKQFVAKMLDMVQDPSVEVCVRALSSLVRLPGFYQLAPATQGLDQLLTDVDAHRRALGVRLLSRIGDELSINRLTAYLADPADEVRLEAAVVAEELSHTVLPGPQVTAPLVEKMTGLWQDPVERIRQAAVVVLGRMGTRESQGLLVNALADFSPQVRATTVDTLAQVGKSAIPLVHPLLNSPSRQLRISAAITLSRINPKEFGALVTGSSVMGNLLTIYHNCGLVEALAPGCAYPSIAVLRSALLEQNQGLLDEIFYLLTAVHDPSAVKIIGKSLRSETERVRANALEALESLTTPEMAGLIGSLFDPGLSPAHLLSLSQVTWDMDHPDTAQAIRQLATRTDDAWLRTIALFVLSEIGIALSPPRPKEDCAANSAPRLERANLLDGLTGDVPGTSSGAEAQPEADKPKARPARRSPPSDLFGALIDTPQAPSHQAEDTPVAAPSPKQAASEAAEGPDPSPVLGLAITDVQEMLEASLADPAADVRQAAQAARRRMAGFYPVDLGQPVYLGPKEGRVLSAVEKIIFLKEVPFFEGMTIDQLKMLANVCEEEFYAEDARIFNEGDPGGALYVVVSGRVGIESEKRKGSFARIATVEAHSYFGEITLFDNGPRTESAIAIKDTLVLRLSREPLIALARQSPDVSLELITALSKRLGEANARIAELSRSRPRQLNKLFDQFDD
jgi:HEAT repeat protein